MINAQRWFVVYFSCTIFTTSYAFKVMAAPRGCVMKHKRRALPIGMHTVCVCISEEGTVVSSEETGDSSEETGITLTDGTNNLWRGCHFQPCPIRAKAGCDVFTALSR